MAAAASVPFIGLWLDAPESMLIDRTAQRRNDASDADASVVRMQRAQDIGDIGWSRLDASGSAASVLSSATDRVRERLHDVLNLGNQLRSSSARAAPWAMVGIRPLEAKANLDIVRHRTYGGAHAWRLARPRACQNTCR